MQCGLDKFKMDFQEKRNQSLKVYNIILNIYYKVFFNPLDFKLSFFRSMIIQSSYNIIYRIGLFWANVCHIIRLESPLLNFWTCGKNEYK